MDPTDLDAYVREACALQGLDLEPTEHARVALQFFRLAAIAAPLMREPLAADDEPAQAFPP